MIRSYVEQQFPDPTQRFRFYLAVAAAAAMAFWLLVVQPLQTQNQQLTSKVVQLQKQRQWMAEGAAQVKASGGRSQSTTQLSQQQITQVARQLKVQVNRIQSKSSGQLQLQLNDAAFDKLVMLLDRLQRQGIFLAQVTFNAQKTPGVVDARLVLGEKDSNR